MSGKRNYIQVAAVFLPVMEAQARAFVPCAE